MIVPPRITDKVMVITEHGERDQIAVLEEDVLVQHYVTRTGARSMVGNVYLGRVQNVLPGMEAAFIDIGRGRNGVLYAGEVNYSPEDLEGTAAPDRAGPEERAGRSWSRSRRTRWAARARASPRRSPCPAGSWCSCRTRTSPASAAGSPTRSGDA